MGFHKYESVAVKSITKAKTHFQSGDIETSEIVFIYFIYEWPLFPLSTFNELWYKDMNIQGDCREETRRAY